MAETFRDKVALVTGAAKGIGAAVAQAFAREGAAVGGMDVDGSGLGRVVDDIRSRGERALSLQADVRFTTDVRQAVDNLANEFGGLDIVVNCAGIGDRLGKLPEFSEEDWDFVIDVNLKGMFQTCRFAIPWMLRRGGGAIVNIASVQAYWSQQGAVAYSASKGGVVAFTRALALDHAREGIRAVAIAPGSVNTPMLMQAARVSNPEHPEQALELWARSHPIGRLIEPEDIANVVLFLASDSASAVTGPTLLVDGAITAGAGAW